MDKLFQFYQKWISPFFGNSCRFHPTCSEYTRLCLHRYSWKGWPKIFWRLLRCHPYCAGGFYPL